MPRTLLNFIKFYRSKIKHVSLADSEVRKHGPYSSVRVMRQSVVLGGSVACVDLLEWLRIKRREASRSRCSLRFDEAGGILDGTVCSAHGAHECVDSPLCSGSTCFVICNFRRV